MSALTKVFVVLLVIMSLLLTSGLVVFVNKQEAFNDQAKKAKQETERERVARMASDAEAVALRGERDRAIQEASGSALALRTSLDAAVQTIAERDATIATANAATSTANAEKATMGLALTAAQEGVKVSQSAIEELRKQNDELQKKYTESQVANSDLINKLDTTNALYRKAREDIVALNEEIDKLRTPGLAGAGAAPRGGAPGSAAPFNPNVSNPGLVAAATPGAPGTTAANIRGVVRARRNIGGVEYATISVGSSDNVARGMQFKVLDRNRSQFLGYLTVDSVEANEATGHLQGPRLESVAPGSEVVTQWQ